MNPSQVDVVLVGLVVLAGLGVMAAFRSGARAGLPKIMSTQSIESGG